MKNDTVVGYSYLHTPYVTIADEIERRRLDAMAPLSDISIDIKPKFKWRDWIKSIFTFKDTNIFKDETDYTKGFYE